MPSKIQLDENLWFLYTCIQKSDMKSIDFAAVAELANIKPPAARMRYTRLKRQIDDGTLTGQHGNTFVPSNSKNATPMPPNPASNSMPASAPTMHTPPTSGTSSFNPSDIHLKYPIPQGETNAKRRKIDCSDWISVSSSNSKAHEVGELEKQEVREEKEGLGKGVSKTEDCDPKLPLDEAKEPGEIEEDSDDDLENIPLSKIRRPNVNSNTPTSPTLHLPRPSPHPSISSTQTSPRPSNSSPISISSTQTSPSLRSNPPPHPFQSATLPYPPPRPPMSSPAIYHGFRGAKRGYRYFQAGNQGREMREYVSPYGMGFGRGNVRGDGREVDGLRGIGGISEPFQSARPVDSIHDREFGRPFARGAWGVEVRRDEGSSL